MKKPMSLPKTGSRLPKDVLFKYLSTVSQELDTPTPKIRATAATIPTIIVLRFSGRIISVSSSEVFFLFYLG
jgi:hypothetical protein